MAMTRWRYDVEIIQIDQVKFSDVRLLCEHTVKEGLDKIVFYDVEEFDFDYFLKFIEMCDGWFYAVKSPGGEFIGYVFMSDFESVRVCRIHFCAFRSARPYLISGGKRVLDWLVPEYFDSLIGWLPEFNAPAIKYLKRLGFHIIGRVPGAVGCAHNADCAAVMSVYTK